MTAALARLNDVVADLVTAHEGVRSVEQGVGRQLRGRLRAASDAVACALERQRAPPAPIRLRVGADFPDGAHYVDLAPPTPRWSR